eukprot:CAMPEP_0171976212 /NCGR_PEP_ID=MMETSP0993-20121228/241018_1 /TAXON_ID=483369 /ORGANISM="non described non described, Strain CCMP2098" /LENGTH=71 /DNA_ID=CAMNT_0012627681 /DNA_START=61 /DNA_END=273 /DNA_ORIENTATION=+
MKGWQLIKDKPPEKVCSPPPPGCTRPCGIFFHYFKLSAGYLVGQGLIAPMFTQTNISWAETYSLAHPGTAA